MMNDFMQSAFQSFAVLHSMFPASSEIIDISDGNHHEIIVIEVRMQDLW